MKHLVEMILEDLSSRDVFLFRASCSECGKEYGNKAVHFSKAGIVPETKGKKIIYEAMREQEFNSARASAIRDAAEYLNYCPICKRLICDYCFLICDDLDMCKQCAAHLEETGSPVLNDVLDAVIEK